MQKISFVFKFQGTVFLSFFFYISARGARDFTNQPITSQNSNLDIGKLTWTFFRVLFLFVFIEFSQFFFSFRWRKFVTPLFGILTFQKNVVVHLKSLIHIFCGVWSLASFFVSWIFYKGVQFTRFNTFVIAFFGSPRLPDLCPVICDFWNVFVLTILLPTLNKNVVPFR